MVNGLRISFWGSSITFQSAMGRLLHFFFMDKKQHKCLRIQITLQKILQKSLLVLLVAVVYNAPPLWCQSGTLPLDEHAVDW